MSKRHPIRRGAFGRGLTLSLASARAGGVFAFDGALRKLKGDEAGNDARLEKEAERFAATLGELKGSYVKIGQIFAMLGEHFLPGPLTRALHQLESQASPLDWAHMQPLYEAALGARFAELEIDRAPLAAASLAQVHRATIRATGEAIVLKGQYPELAAVLDEDFDAVVRMLRFARWIPAGREFDSWLAVMREQLHAEIDYPRELAMAERLAAGLRDNSHFPRLRNIAHVPRYFPDFSAPGVLACEYIPGYRVGSPQVAKLPQPVRNELGRTMLELFFAEVFELGLMQVDPNFGNYLIAPDGERLALLDFGSVMELEGSTRAGLAQAIIAGHVGDDQRLLSALVALGCLRKDSPEHARDTFRGFIRHLLEPLRNPEELPPEYLNSDGEYCWGQSQLLNRAGRKAAGSAASRHFVLPSGDFALIARKLTGVFSFIAVLKAEFNAWEIVAPFVDSGEVGDA